MSASVIGRFRLAGQLPNARHASIASRKPQIAVTQAGQGMLKHAVHRNETEGVLGELAFSLEICDCCVAQFHFEGAGHRRLFVTLLRSSSGLGSRAHHNDTSKSFAFPFSSHFIEASIRARADSGYHDLRISTTLAQGHSRALGQANVEDSGRGVATLLK